MRRIDLCVIGEGSAWARALSTWHARYLAHADARADGSPRKGTFRPASTENEFGPQKGYWAVYWEVTELEPLQKNGWVKISSLRGLGTGKTYPASFRPERPMLIEAP